MKCISFIVGLLSVLASCAEINESDLQGEWNFYPNREASYFTNFKFEGDSVEILDNYYFKEKGTFHIEGDSIKILREKDDFSIGFKIERLNKDTLEIESGNPELNWLFLKDDWVTNKPEKFDLVDIESNKTRSELPGSYYFSIHLYRKDDSLKLRLGQRLSRFDDIPLYLEVFDGPQPNMRKILLFLGENVILEELEELYLRLTAESYGSVYIILKRAGLKDFYIMPDKNNFWPKEYNDFLSKLKPKRPTIDDKFQTKTEFLEGGGIEIKFESEADSLKMKNLSFDKRYLFSFNKDLPMKEFLKLKMKSNALLKAKFNIRYEIE